MRKILKIALCALLPISLLARKSKVFHTLKVEFGKDDVVTLADKQPMQCNICNAKPNYIHVDNGLVSAYCNLHVTRDIRQMVDKK